MTRKKREETRGDSRRDLWCAVIQLAIDDALGASYIGGSAAEVAIERDRASRWLTTPNRDFNTVCYLAGLDPQAVRARVAALRSPGVGLNFSARLGTGGGSVARHFSHLEISK